MVGPAGYLRKENGHSVEDEAETKKNGNGSNGNGNGNGGGSVSEANKSGDSSLRDWFGKSRSSDGKLVGFNWWQICRKTLRKTTRTNNKTQVCSSKMKRNLSKDEEEAAFRRKNRKDPNPDRKGKAINVNTEETVIELKAKKTPVTIRSSHVIQFGQVHMRQEHWSNAAKSVLRIGK